MGKPRTAAQVARDRLGNARRRGDDPEHVDQARRELAEAKLAATIRKVVDAAPPLTAAQRERLVLLLNPAGGDDGQAAA